MIQERDWNNVNKQLRKRTKGEKELQLATEFLFSPHQFSLKGKEVTKLRIKFERSNTFAGRLKGEVRTEGN